MTVRATSIASLVALAVACGGGGPDLASIPDQITAVGEELVVEIRAEGDHNIRYGYESSQRDLADRATLATRPDGSAVWTFRPDASDVGAIVVDFKAVDASGTSTESVLIDVRSAIGNATLPVFRRPMGSGTVLDGDKRCIDVAIEVTDQDSTEVELTVQRPVIEGGELLQETGFEAVWHWCPTPAQRATRDRYLLTIAADDGDNPPAIKRYQIILRDHGKPACAGAEPVIVHEAADQVTLNDIQVVAQVDDDQGLKGAPLLYYSLVPPGDPIDLSTMTQLTMESMGFIDRGGTFQAQVPNPLVDAPPGSSQTIYYVLVAEDNDDAAGDCDHVVLERFEMQVSTPGGAGDLGLCSPCSADDQCGDAGDHCLRVGLEGDSFCFRDCAGGCPDGYVCSAEELTSVNGATGRQCVPIDERCDASDGCRADAAEPNDSRLQAQPLNAGISGRICPLGATASEEDWFSLDLTSDSDVGLDLDGLGDLDIDLALYDENGILIAAAESAAASEIIGECLPRGRYYVRVYSYFAGSNDYTLRATTADSSCPEAWWGECREDASEDDDDRTSARQADVDAVYRSRGNQICTGDDDWYAVYLYQGETLYGTLDFRLRGSAGDLDLLIYDDRGTLMTPCLESAPAGCSDNGQASRSGESIYYDATYSGTHYVVVHGWGGGENSYDICLAVSSGGCPAK
jgi:hypothetical protein